MKNNLKMAVTGGIAAVIIATAAIPAFAASDKVYGQGAANGAAKGTAICSNMASGSVLTAEQRDALKNATQANLKTELDKLVAAGTINSDQEAAILAPTEHRLMDAGLTVDQKEAVRVAMTAARTSALEQLIADGTLPEGTVIGNPNAGPKPDRSNMTGSGPMGQKSQMSQNGQRGPKTR